MEISRELEEKLIPLENMRRKFVFFLLSYRILTAVLISIPLLIVIWAMAFSGNYSDIMQKYPYAYSAFMITLTVLLFIIIFIYNHFKSKSGKIHGEIMQVLVNYLHPSLTYNRNKFVLLEKFKNSGIYLNPQVKNITPLYMGEDYCRGKVGDVNIEFSEVKFYYHNRKTNLWYFIPGFNFLFFLYKYFIKAGISESGFYDFRGLFFIADFNKHFKGSTLVLPDYFEKSFGMLGRMFQRIKKNHGKIAFMDIPAFEKEFVVFTTDQVEARYVLSTSLMDRIVQLREAVKSKMAISIRNSHLYVTIPSRKDLFSFNMRKSILNPDQISKIVDEINFCLALAEDLNLNRKIWSK